MGAKEEAKAAIDDGDYIKAFAILDEDHWENNPGEMIEYPKELWDLVDAKYKAFSRNVTGELTYDDYLVRTVCCQELSDFMQENHLVPLMTPAFVLTVISDEEFMPSFQECPFCGKKMVFIEEETNSGI